MRRFSRDHTLSSSEVLGRFNLELERCPFCLTADVSLQLSYNPHVTCLGCGADGPLPDPRSYPQMEERLYRAVLAWNLRRKS